MSDVHPLVACAMWSRPTSQDQIEAAERHAEACEAAVAAAVTAPPEAAEAALRHAMRLLDEALRLAVAEYGNNSGMPGWYLDRRARLFARAQALFGPEAHHVIPLNWARLGR